MLKTLSYHLIKESRLDMTSIQRPLGEYIQRTVLIIAGFYVGSLVGEQWGAYQKLTNYSNGELMWFFCGLGGVFVGWGISLMISPP
jgi:hypothetical protein